MEAKSKLLQDRKAAMLIIYQLLKTVAKKPQFLDNAIEVAAGRIDDLMNAERPIAVAEERQRIWEAYYYGPAHPDEGITERLRAIIFAGAK